MEESKSEVKVNTDVKMEEADVDKIESEDVTTNDTPDIPTIDGEATTKDETGTENGTKNEEANGTAKTEEEEPSAEALPLKKKRKQKAPPVETQEAANKRERRERKSVETFDPNAFRKASRTVTIVDGRGARLGDLAPCVQAMESLSQHLPVAYRLVFKFKGQAKKKEMMQDLLEFNGYLPKKDASLKEAEQDERDDEVEAKMGAKAYKLMLPQLKSLCDFFGVDRRGLSTKDDVVDQLLDFLSEPSVETLVSTSKKGGGAAKTTKKSKNKRNSSKSKKDGDADDDDDGEDEVDKDHPDYDDVDDDKLKADNGKAGQMPSQDKLRKWVRAYVRCFHETKLTVNHALEVASEKFGVDLTPKKADLRKLLIDEL